MTRGRNVLALVAAVLAITACDRIVTVTEPAPDHPAHADTVVVVRPETSYVQHPGRVDTVVKWDTAYVVTHDTVVVHDTVTHVDTLWRETVLTALCVVALRADSLYLDTLARGCTVDRVRLDYPTLPIVRGDTMRLVAGQTVQLHPLTIYGVITHP